MRVERDRGAEALDRAVWVGQRRRGAAVQDQSGSETSEGHRDVNLFFDKDKGFLVKTETRAADLMSGEEKTEEKVLQDYKQQDGYFLPTRVTVLQDGKELLSLEIEEIKIVDRFDEDTFTKP